MPTEIFTLSYKLGDGSVTSQVRTWLKQHCEETGCTYYDLAQRVGVEPLYLKEIEKEIVSMSLSDVVILMQNFGMEVEVLYPGHLALDLVRETEKLTQLRKLLQKVLDEFNPSLLPEEK